jgi:hypothetical protein
LHVLGSGINAGQPEGGGKSLEIRRFGFNLLSFVQYSDNSEQRSLFPAGGHDGSSALHGSEC